MGGGGGTEMERLGRREVSEGGGGGGGTEWRYRGLLGMKGSLVGRLLKTGCIP